MSALSTVASAITRSTASYSTGTSRTCNDDDDDDNNSNGDDDDDEVTDASRRE